MQPFVKIDGLVVWQVLSPLGVVPSDEIIGYVIILVAA